MSTPVYRGVGPHGLGGGPGKYPGQTAYAVLRHPEAPPPPGGPAARWERRLWTGKEIFVSFLFEFMANM